MERDINDLEVYNWETEFNTVEGTMTHTLSDRVKVITNFKTYMISAIKDGVLFDHFSFKDNYSLGDYEKYLLSKAKDANDLSKFAQHD